jgi:uncharacterized membrane protein YedE/YeeE
VTELDPHIVTAIGGLFIGIVFGAAVQLTNFCSMGGISDYVLIGNGSRLRAWVLATAVAIVGTQLLAWQGLIDLSQAIYLTPNLGWLGAIVGGFLFGFGMTKASGCGSKNVVRIGGGSLKAVVVVLVMGVVGYMTLRGLLGPLRLQLETTNVQLAASGIASQSMADVLANATGMALEMMAAIVAIIFPLALLVWCFKDAEFRSSPRDIIGGLIVGLCVVAGWMVTGILGADDFSPVPLASMTFVAPAAESLQYLMTWTGASVNFGIAVFGGVILGAFLASAVTGNFHLEGFADSQDTYRHIGGAILMGFGGVLALGCSIGQGTTGMSTLATGSLIAWLSILAGGYLGIKHLEEGSLIGALRASLARA